jgi:signal transduction histidine kinase
MDLRACSLHGAIKEALEVLQEQFEQREIIAQTDFDAESEVVHGDPEALKSVFINLFLNSAEAMENGGTLHVSTEGMERKGNRHGIRVRIADTGPGVPLEDRTEIFNPFFTTKKDGTGLGLSLAARIVEGHQGDLKLADPSEAGSGSTFVIELPLMLEEEGV